MTEAAGQSDPLGALWRAVGLCEPDETALRGLVIATLRRDPDLLERIAGAEGQAYDGSLSTMRAFLDAKAWPAEDDGWVDETLSLSRWGYWYTRADRPSYARRDDGIDRPNTRITTLVLCASVLVADCARHARFSNADSEPSAETCFAIVDASCRLGGAWPAAACGWLADHTLYWCQKEDEWYNAAADATRNIAVPLAMLAAWRSVREGVDLPVHELFDAVNRTALHHERENRAAWPGPIVTIRPNEARVIKESVLDPVLDQLAGETRASAERFCKRFIGR